MAANTLHRLKELLGYTAPELLEEKLVAFIDNAVDAEREACAELALEKRQFDKTRGGQGRLMAERIARAIRSRKEPVT